MSVLWELDANVHFIWLKLNRSLHFNFKTWTKTWIKTSRRLVDTGTQVNKTWGVLTAEYGTSYNVSFHRKLCCVNGGMQQSVAQLYFQRKQLVVFCKAVRRKNELCAHQLILRTLCTVSFSALQKSAWPRSMSFKLRRSRFCLSKKMQTYAAVPHYRCLLYAISVRDIVSILSNVQSLL